MTNLNTLLHRPGFFSQSFENGAAAIAAFRKLSPVEAATVENHLVIANAYALTWIEQCLFDWINENLA